MLQYHYVVKILQYCRFHFISLIQNQIISGCQYTVNIGIGAGLACLVLAGPLFWQFNKIHYENCTHAYYHHTTSIVSALWTCVRCQHDIKWAQFSLDNFLDQRYYANRVQVTYLQKRITKIVAKGEINCVWVLH